MSNSYESPGHQVRETLRVTKLVVQNSGTYNPMYMRPYHTQFNADIADDLNRRLHDNNGQSTTSIMAGLANRILMPLQQHEGMIPIVNGWDQPRGRFIMTVEKVSTTGAICHYHIQGYTSHYDLSHGGHPDPSMMFFVNSFLRTTRAYINSPTGVVPQDIVLESAQIINGRMVSTMMNNTNLYGMRPNEIYSVMQSDPIMANIYGQHNVRDDRHMLTNRAVPSFRSNNLPANLLSRMVDSYQVSSSNLAFGNDTDQALGRSKGYVYEGVLNENSFFRMLSNVTNQMEATSFRLSELLHIDPNVMDPHISVFIRANDMMLRKLPRAGETEFWHRPDDMSAWVCSVLTNAVPTIMMDLMLIKIVFNATNHSVPGQHTIGFGGGRDLANRDLGPIFEIFRTRIAHEVLQDITYGNEVGYNLTMSVDLFGDTTIDIQYGNTPMTRYVAPSFCDSLMSPVLTVNESTLQNTVNDFSQIFKGLEVVTRPYVVSEVI